MEDKGKEVVVMTLEQPKKKKEEAVARTTVNAGVGTALMEERSKHRLPNCQKLLKPEVQDYIRSSLLKPYGKKKLPYICAFVDKYLKEAITDVSSKAGEQIGKILFNKEDFLGQLDETVKRVQSQNLDFQKYLVRQTLYNKQQEVFDDEISRKILIINSRRSGKTELMGRMIVKDLLNPGHRAVYINRNSTAAIRQIRGPLNASLEKVELHVIKGSVDSQELYFDNGSMLYIIGNNNSSDIDKLRGEKASLVIMDECGHQRNTRKIIQEVIEPLLMDYKDSMLVMVGTPPRNKGTYVEEVYNHALERNWTLYSWTFMDNPFIENKDKVIEQVCQETGCTVDAAFIQREYFGRMNVYDDDAKVIKKYSIIDKAQWNRIKPNSFSHAFVAVDFGFEDKAAVISVLVDGINKRAYVVDSWSQSHRGITDLSQEIIRQVDELKSKYNLERPVKVICDDNVKEAVYDLNTIYHIPNVFIAYKYNKDMALEQLSDFCASNRISIVEGNDVLKQDLDNTLWKRDEETDRIIYEIDDDVWHPNAMMALLYASRQFAYEVMDYRDLNKDAKNVLRGIKETNLYDDA